MSDDYFSILADNASKVVNESQKSTKSLIKNNSGCLPKIFTVVFVALLLYMGFNFAKINTPSKADVVTVGGAFYGSVQADKNGNINIPIGNKNNLSPAINVTHAQKDPNKDGDRPNPEPDPQPEPDPKPEPKPISKPNSNLTYIKLSDRLKVGMSYTDVLGWLGLPTKKLEVLNEMKQTSGFVMCIWDVADKRVMITFYKNKLHSITYQ